MTFPCLHGMPREGFLDSVRFDSCLHDVHLTPGWHAHATAVRPQPREHRSAICAGKIARRPCEGYPKGRPIFNDVATSRQIALGLSEFQIKLTWLSGRIVRHGCSSSNALLLYREWRANVRVVLYCAACFQADTNLPLVTLLRLPWIGGCIEFAVYGDGCSTLPLLSALFAICQFQSTLVNTRPLRVN